jgi:hypothetical protein
MTWLAVSHFVLVAVLLGAVQAPAQTSASPARSVQGTVFDSLGRKPLPGAAVSLVAVNELTSGVRTAVSDSAGRYEIAGVLPGTYLVGFFHPELDSVGIDPITRRIIVPPDGGGSSLRADLGVPSGHTVHDAICQKPASRSDSTGVLIGHVRDAASGDPLDSAKVVAQWSLIGFADGHLTHSMPTLTVTPNAAGWFAFCGLPASVPIAIQGISGTDSTGVLMIDIAPLGLTRRELYVGTAEIVTVAPMPDSSRATDSLPPSLERVHRGTGRLTGVVRDAASGKPLPGAQLTVEGTGLTTMANDDGTFALSGLPLGTRVLLARKVGYVPDERPVDLVANGPARAEASLVTIKSVLDTVRIVGRRVYDADRSGFLRRQKVGLGHYFDPEQIEKAHAFETSDLFRRVPSVRVDQNGFDKIVLMRSMFGGGRCQPNIYVDGAAYRNFSASDLDNMVHPDRIAGLEVYESALQAPPEFQDPFSNCGSIVVWTKR